MAIFKRFFLVFACLYLIASLAIFPVFFEPYLACGERDRKPTGSEVQKIHKARNLLIKEPGIPEPIYLVVPGQCYNAYAAKAGGVISISRPMLAEFSETELAGAIGHEFGHLINNLKPQENRAVFHWQIDIIGAELAGKEAIIALHSHLIQTNRVFLENNKSVKYLSPVTYYSVMKSTEDLVFRSQKVLEYNYKE